MNINYTIHDLQQKREAAGLGVLSLATYGQAIVSSTPIPGNRFNDLDNVTAYGGHLVGEGMTQAAAVYLATLHNHFPALADAAQLEFKLDQAARALLEMAREDFRLRAATPFGEVADWWSGTIGSQFPVSAETQAKKVLEEAHELCNAIKPESLDPAMPELADVMIACIGFATFAGWNLGLLVRARLEEIKGRNWAQDETTGLVRHIEEVPHA